MKSRRHGTPLLLALVSLLGAGCYAPQSDDFNTCQIDAALWSFVDPRGDSTAQVIGGGTGEAQLQISVPAGTSHDPWNVNNAARLVQPIPDRDFAVRAKLDSPVAGAVQMQGLMVEGGVGHWVRFDVFSNATGTRLFAGTVVDGSGEVRLNQSVAVAFPLQLELRREGDQWTASHSSDGETWVVDASFSHPMAASSVGVFAGNAGDNPAHTAVIDFFWSQASPLVGEEDAGPVPDDNALAIYVFGSGTVALDPPPPAGGYACAASVSLTAQPDPGWVFHGWAGQASGEQNPLSVTLAGPRAVLAMFQPLTTPPTISDIAIAVTESSATVSWETNHPSTSSVAYGETTAYELGTLDDPTLVQSHSMVLSGLSPGTTHHLQITSENEAGIASSSPDQTFVTLAVPPSQGIVSDDFNVCALDPDVWTFVDPLLDASYALVGGGTGDAQLQISVPAGTSHDPFDTNRAPRLIQAAANGDFEIEAKFDSPVSERYQIQGLVAEADATNFVRFDVFHDGTETRLFAGTNVAGSGQTKFNIAIPGATFPISLRLRREGDQWTASHSFDGASYVTDGTFAHAIALNAVGVQAANNSPNPAHTALIDWFASTASPIVDEDGAILPAENTLTLSTTGDGSVSATPDQSLYVCGETVSLAAQPGAGSYFTGWSGDLTGTQNPDTLVMNTDRDVTANFAPIDGPPTISGLQVVAVTESTATIQWSTNHPSDSVVEYGTTTAYELGSVSDPALVTSHSVILTGLAPETPYHFRVSSTNELSFTTTSGDQLFITQTAGGPGGPLVQVWYGDQQHEPDYGGTQPFFNVLGNVLDADGVASLSYTLNGGSSAALSLGPDGRRLADPGDFNIELPVASLVPGLNTVAITAIDGIGEVTHRTVLVDHVTGAVWPMNYVIDWNQVNDLQDAVQVVDGHWLVGGGVVRTIQVDYDRLLALGDDTWTDYEAVVPITIHGYSDKGFNQFSNRPGVGLLMRWVSHLPPGQPQRGFKFGAVAFYRIGQDGINKLEMWTEDSSTTPGMQLSLDFDVPYLFKVQAETLEANHQYRVKVWQQGTPEPPGWSLVEDQPLTEPGSGALLLVAHHMDISFGTVTVTPLP